MSSGAASIATSSWVSGLRRPLGRGAVGAAGCRTAAPRCAATAGPAVPLSRSRRFPASSLLQHLLADACALRGERKIQLTGDGISRRPDGRQQAVERLTTMLDSLEVSLPLQHLDLALEQIDRVAQHRLPVASTPPFRTSVSGSSPGGSVATRTRMP